MLFLYVIFWILFFLPIISFLIYPLVIFLIFSLSEKIKWAYNHNFIPNVSIIIVAYNEEAVIRKRIENLLNYSYPRDKIEIIIHTDGSNDSTDEIVSQYISKGVRLITNEKNRGKTVSLNDAVKSASSDILIFSDANSIFNENSIQYLVQHLRDPLVGCVCGKLEYMRKSNNAAEKGERKYWDWDTKIKIWEGHNGRLIGSNGAIFALRKEFAVNLPGDQSNDMIFPIIARLNGFKVIYEPNAIAVEETGDTVKKEYKRKARIIARGLSGIFFSLNYLIKENKNKVSIYNKTIFLFQLFCKKFFRYLAFPSITIIMILGIFLPSGIEKYISFLMICGFSILLLSTVFMNQIKKYFPKFPDFSYYIAVYFASLTGLYYFISKKNISQWKSQR